MSRPRSGVESTHQTNAPALPKQPGARQQGGSPDATSTLLSAENLAFAARVHRAQRDFVKDKAYRALPIGGEVGRFLRTLRWSDASENTLLSYETTLSRLTYYFADKTLADLTTDDLRDFLDEHWGESAAATRRQRLAALKSFFAFCVQERGLEHNPIQKIKPPKRTDVARNAYTPDIIDQLREAQPTLRDQIAVQLLGRLGLRKNELRLIQVGDFDLIHGTCRFTQRAGTSTRCRWPTRRSPATLRCTSWGAG